MYDLVSSKQVLENIKLSGQICAIENSLKWQEESWNLKPRLCPRTWTHLCRHLWFCSAARENWRKWSWETAERQKLVGDGIRFLLDILAIYSWKTFMAHPYNHSRSVRVRYLIKWNLCYQLLRHIQSQFLHLLLQPSVSPSSPLRYPSSQITSSKTFAEQKTVNR